MKSKLLSNKKNNLKPNKKKMKKFRNRNKIARIPKNKIKINKNLKKKRMIQMKKNPNDYVVDYYFLFYKIKLNIQI